MPSRDVAAELESFSRDLGARVVFAIEAMGTRVAMLELSPDPPRLLLADHLDGERPVLVYRVADIESARGEIEGRGWEPGPTFEIPFGPVCEFRLEGGHRIAIYEVTRPEMEQRLAGRRDF
jgi:hypothetical protein